MNDSKRQRIASLMERLDKILLDYSLEEGKLAESKSMRLRCAVAAEQRKWGTSTYKSSGMPSLIELAEDALGAAFCLRCKELQMDVNYRGLTWTPSAYDHNSELCRIRRKVPACE